MVIIENGIFENRFPYAKFGSGPRTLVIIPGTGSLTLPISKDSSMQMPMYAKMIPSDVTTYLIDFPLLEHTATFESIAADYAGIIRRNLGKVSVAGISYGGFIVIPLAAQFPEIIEQVFLIISGYALSEKGMQNIVKKGLEFAESKQYLKFFYVFDDLYNVWWIRWLVKLMTRRNLKASVAHMNPIANFIFAYQQILKRNGELKQYLHQIRAPTMIAGGTKDKCFSEANYRETASMIPNAKLELIPGAGHMVPVERMQQFKAILSRYI
jgi:pimeloyl-ACP methyl ester carboxylesterase